MCSLYCIEIFPISKQAIQKKGNRTTRNPDVSFFLFLREPRPSGPCFSYSETPEQESDMNKLLYFLSHTSIQLRFVSLMSSGILFTLGILMGFFSWDGVLFGSLFGLLAGILFWVETNEPLYGEGQFPVTGTQKLSYLVRFFAYAVFLGCVVDRFQEYPSAEWILETLRISLFGSLGYLITYTLIQLVRLSVYLFHGGVLDRFIWKERRTGMEGMIDRTGVVREELRPEGKIFVHGELWNAITEDGQTVQPGAKVKIERMKGLTLYVRPQPSTAIKTPLHQDSTEDTR